MTIRRPIKANFTGSDVTSLGEFEPGDTLDPALVGLDNVNNTSDANKPVSTATQTALDLKQNTSAKDASSGYPGLTLFKLNLRNAANTVTSWFTTAATAARTWTMPDKDGTVAMLSDITGTNSGTNTGDETAATIKTKLGISTLSGSNTGDQTASTVANTPAGNIAATNVQAALNELDTEKLPANATALNGTTIPASKTLVVTTDIGVSVQPYDVDTPNVAASQAEMEAGTGASLRSMSPLRVAQAIKALGGVAGYKNVIINGNFSVNQRGYVSAAEIGTNLYGHDRWKMAASADTYTFATVENVTTVTIPAGKVLRQVVEGLNLQSGTYTLSWTGTAQGKIGAGAYGASGITGTVVGGTNLTIEFGPGTVSKVQFEFGSIATPFENRPIGLELELCQRYYYQAIASVFTTATLYAPGYVQTAFVPFPVEMRAIPTVSMEVFTSSTLGTIGTMYSDKTTRTGVSRVWNTNGGTVGSGGQIIYTPLTASAEL